MDFVFKPKILLIDDNPINLYFLEETLSVIDAELISANSGFEAIEEVQKNEFSLILSDVQMPGIDGIETIKKIKEFEASRETPVIFISAVFTREEDILKGIETGAVDFLPKPFNIKILLGKVENFMRLYKIQKEWEFATKKLEQSYSELDANKNLLEKITSSVNEAIILINEKQNIIYWNTAAEITFGVSSKEIKNKSLWEIITPQENKNALQQILAKPISKAKELNVITQDKKTITIEFTTSEIEINDEKHIVGVFRDISERKKMHEEMLRAKEIKESNKTMRTFLDNISHELRTPLNSIIGISRNILKEKESECSKEQLEGLNIILSSGEKLNAVLKNILEFKSPDKMSLTSIPLKTILSDLEEFVPQMIPPEKNIIFKTDYDEQITSSEIITDQTKLAHMLINAIENAIKFTAEGKIALEIKKNESYFIFKVSDTGIGIKKEDLDSIFNAFTQLDGDSDRKYGGTGLGLSLIKKNIEQLGGKITVESEPNKGTVVSLYHPIN